jgi:hypothetical protein
VGSAQPDDSFHVGPLELSELGNKGFSFRLYIVTELSIARQRVRKHILAATNTQTIEELPFLCNGNVKLTSITIEELLRNGVFCGVGAEEL